MTKEQAPRMTKVTVDDMVQEIDVRIGVISKQMIKRHKYEILAQEIEESNKQ